MNGNATLEARYRAVLERIERAAVAAGRDADSVRLLAVGKTFPTEDVRALAALGQREFGENYVQEAEGKIAALAELELAWHYIGPIQSNKTRRIAESFDWAQSVEDERIARRLSAQRPADRPPLNVCLQVNLSGEATKSGCRPDEVLALALAVKELPNLALRGLMSIPEPTEDAAFQARRFGELRSLFEQARERLGTMEPGFDTLSMGMSADLEAAIAQGATLVRVGSAIFGERPRPQG
jgi:pyridoxal phosphate enzyme (YggS family)